MPIIPGGTDSDTKATITIGINTVAPQGGCGIKFNIEPVENSGGHQHSNNNPIRPGGNVSPNPADISEGDTSVTAVYSSKEISGTEKIELKLGDKVISEPEIEVKVPGLASLEFGDYDLKCFVMDCGSYKHSDHYRVKPWVKTGFGNIAAAYKAAFPNDHILIVNDGSLPWGGLYDYKDTWKPPHGSHRIGTDIDVRSKNIPERNRKDFEKLACDSGGYPKLEYPGADNEHYHLYFAPYIDKHYNLCSNTK